MRPSSPSANRTIPKNVSNPRPNFGDGGFMQIQAFSKINLFLEVLEKRADNYHNLRTVMQSLSLADTLTFTISNDAPALRITCDHPTLPTNEKNLVHRAATYIMKQYDIKNAIHIHIEKRIPIAAGLGGGSSDCAATLVAMNELFKLELSVEDLRTIGLTFGADVPFCITGGTMLAEGVGERLTALDPLLACWFVLACLPIEVSTADIFSRVDLTNRTTLALAENMLEPITTMLYPEVANLINKMKELGAVQSAMSGSGPSVFGKFMDEPSAQHACNEIKKITNTVYITRPERMRNI